MPTLRSVHRFFHKLVPTMLAGLGAVLYRAGQEIGWIPKDVIVFPFLALLAWALFLYWFFAGPRAVRLYSNAYKKWAKERRRMAYGLAILIGSLVGGGTGAGAWKLFESHRKQMAKLKEKPLEEQSTHPPEVTEKDRTPSAAEKPVTTKKSEVRPAAPKSYISVHFVLSPQVVNGQLAFPVGLFSSVHVPWDNVFVQIRKPSDMKWLFYEDVGTLRAAGFMHLRTQFSPEFNQPYLVVIGTRYATFYETLTLTKTDGIFDQQIKVSSADTGEVFVDTEKKGGS